MLKNYAEDKILIGVQIHPSPATTNTTKSNNINYIHVTITTFTTTCNTNPQRIIINWFWAHVALQLFIHDGCGHLFYYALR